MPKRILVPLDGTENSEAALRYIPDLCAPGDEVTLLRVEKPQPRPSIGTQPGQGAGFVSTTAGTLRDVVPPDQPIYAETEGQALQRQRDETRDYLERLAAGLRESGLEVTTHVLIEAKVDEAIIDYARARQSTTIAMVRRTHSVVGDLFGSVALSVIRSGVAPVLVLPPSSR
jgi:nucleotide-binding universal stress UspA family protein